MVMFKAKFRPLGDKPSASDQPRASDRPAAGRLAKAQQQQQQQPQPIPPHPTPEPTAPPIEKERGPQYPVREPGPGNPPERA